MWQEKYISGIDEVVPHLHNSATLYRHLGQDFFLEIQGKAPEFHVCTLTIKAVIIQLSQLGSKWAVEREECPCWIWVKLECIINIYYNAVFIQQPFLPNMELVMPWTETSTGHDRIQLSIHRGWYTLQRSYSLVAGVILESLSSPGQLVREQHPQGKWLLRIWKKMLVISWNYQLMFL